MDRYSRNKIQRLYRRCSNYVLIVDNGLRIYEERRTQIFLSSPVMQGSMIDRVYIDIKIANNTKIKKTTTLQQVTGGKIPNLVLKRILELFLKIPPLKKILD